MVVPFFYGIIALNEDNSLFKWLGLIVLCLSRLPAFLKKTESKQDNSPKLDEQQENYINCCTDMLWAMPKTLVGDNAERAAVIIEAFQCYNYNHMLPVYFEGALKARIADSPDDAEMMQIIADTRAISFAFTYTLAFRNLVADCVTGKYEVASYFKRGEKTARNALNNMVNKYLDLD